MERQVCWMQANSFIRNRYQRWLAALPILFAMLLVPLALWAQGGEATITGTVHDSTGAVVPGANVILTDQNSNAVRVTKSNGTGFFSFAAVPPGTYTVTVGMQGFSQYVQKNLAIHPLDQVSLRNIALKPGTASTTVEVNAEAADIVPVDTGEKSETIEAKQIQNLAIEGRNAVELLKILPGVVNQGGFNGEVTAFNGGVGSYNINGTRSDSLALTNDGADIVDPGCNCGAAVTPNVDMLSEVKVQTSNFSSENNKGPVVIQTVDKSGGAQFHGEAYYSLRDSSMNANDWQNNANHVAKPKSKFQYPGFNIGGPVLIPGTSFNKHRDKLFFFAGFEWMRQGVDLGLKRADVPTKAMREGDYTDASYIKSLFGYDVNALPCQPGAPDKTTGVVPPLPGYCAGVGLINPASFDPGGRVLVNQYPLPNADPSKTQGYNYLSDIVNPQNRDQQLVRIDYNISNNTKLYSRFNRENETEPYPYGLWWNPSDVPYPSNIIGGNTSRSLSTSLTNVFSPTMTNELVVAITRLDLPNTLNDPKKVSRTALNYPYRGLYAPAEDVVPDVTDWGGGVAGIINPGGFTPALFADKWINSVTDNVSKVAGMHLFKFGAYYEHLTNDQPTNNYTMGFAVPTTWSGVSSGNAYADLLLGRIGDFQQSTANLTGNMAEDEFDFYGQDSWKATPRLTLNYGVRAYHLGWMYEKHGRIGVFVPSTYDPNSVQNGAVVKYTGIETHASNPAVPQSGFKQPGFRLAPTVGFAWDVTGNASTVLRGGFGTYYYRDQGNVFFGAIGNPPQEFNTEISGGHMLSDFDSMTPAGQVVNLNVLDPTDTRVPVTYSWSLTLSKKMPWSTVVEASYVANSSHNQENTSNVNLVPEGSELGMFNPGSSNDQSFRPYKSYQNISKGTHFLTQNYNSLQITASRQTGRVNYSVAYTFSKTLGTGGQYSAGSSVVDPFNTRGRSYGILPYDRTHILSVAYNVLLPNFGSKYLGNHAITNGVLNGWQFSGISQFQSGAPEYFGSNIAMDAVIDSGTTTAISNSDGSKQELAFDSRHIDGTPDSSAHPFTVCNPVANLAPQEIFNANCFQAPSIGKNGYYQLPYYIRGPWYNNNDLSAFKNFALGKNENRKLQLRFEAFNFMNHPLWGFIGNDPALHLRFDNYGGKPLDGVGGTATSTGKPAGFMTNKFGHRTVQIALKLFF